MFCNVTVTFYVSHADFKCFVTFCKRLSSDSVRFSKTVRGNWFMTNIEFSHKNKLCISGTFSISFWRQYVSLYASIGTIVSLLLTSDRKSSRNICDGLHLCDVRYLVSYRNTTCLKLGSKFLAVFYSFCNSFLCIYLCSRG